MIRLGRPGSILVAALLFALAGLRAEAQDSFAAPNLRADLEAAVSRERVLQGLAPVRSSDALRRAAQAHVEDMERGGYFALEGPQGSPTLESLVEKEGYPFTLVTEKLVRTSLFQTVDSLVAGWHTAPAVNRSSLFLPDVHEIGVGVIESGDVRLIAIVLASAGGDSPTASSSQSASFAELARRPEAARKALCAAISDQRRAWGLSPLRIDTALGEAASRHAEDVLQARLANRPTDEVVSLADLVAEQRARSGLSVETSGEVSRQRRHAPRGSGVGESVGQVIVTDAASPEEALEMALRQPSSALRDARYRIVAVGLAVQPPASAAETGHSVWVLAVATH
jgi:uncharacterized protein YkwD